MSQSHVAAVRNVTGQKISGSQAVSGPDGPGRASELGQLERGDVITAENLVTDRRGCGPRSELAHIRFELESSNSMG
jgi:hypothetical protein